MDKIQVVVMGRNYSSLLGMIRAVGVSDCEITLVKTISKTSKKNGLKSFFKNFFIGKPLETQSKYVKKILYAIEPDRESLINVLLNEFFDTKNKVILLPTDDFTASTIDLYQDKLQDKFLFPNILNTKEKIVELMDKDIQKEIAYKNGLNVAKGYVINSNKGKYLLPDDLVYPVFTKPQTSFKGNKDYMKKCEDENELRKFLNDIFEYKECPILVEQYIEIEKEYAILGCSYNKKIVMPAIIEMIKSGSGSHKGVTMVGKVLPLDIESELYKKLELFMKSLDFNGLFDIDLYQSNSRVYFNELNLRFGASGYAITQSGVNLPEIFIKNLYQTLNKVKTKIIQSS